MERMADMNDNLTDLQKVAMTEFELDSEERSALLEETASMMDDIRKKVSNDDLIKDFTHHVIKAQCWDNHEVKGRSLLAYNLPIEVPNYPLYKRSEEQLHQLEQAKCRRRIEIALSGFFKKQCEKVARKSSSVRLPFLSHYFNHSLI